VPLTAADMRELAAWVEFRPNTPVTAGVANFVKWYRNFYNV
jgi:UDP-glucuronate 4-epimerase